MLQVFCFVTYLCAGHIVVARLLKEMPHEPRFEGARGVGKAKRRTRRVLQSRDNVCHTQRQAEELRPEKTHRRSGAGSCVGRCPREGLTDRWR